MVQSVHFNKKIHFGSSTAISTVVTELRGGVQAGTTTSLSATGHKLKKNKDNFKPQKRVQTQLLFFLVDSFLCNFFLLCCPMGSFINSNKKEFEDAECMSTPTNSFGMPKRQVKSICITAARLWG